MFVLKFSIDFGLREKAYFTMNANNKHSKSRHVCIISHDMPVMYDRLEIKNKKHNSGSTVLVFYIMVEEFKMSLIFTTVDTH